MAPLPGRVGMSETTAAPQAKANSADFTAHSKPSASLMNGGFTKTNALIAIPA